MAHRKRSDKEDEFNSSYSMFSGEDLAGADTTSSVMDSYETYSNPGEEKVKILLEHLQNKKWDVDSLARDLTDEEMKLYLKVGERFELIKYIAEGYRVSTEDEDTILRLLRTTPQNNVKELVELLNDINVLKELQSAMDNDNYVRFHNTLRALAFEGREVEEAASDITFLKQKEGIKKNLGEHGRDKVFFWLDPTLLRNFEFHLHKIHYQNLELKEGKVCFDLKLQQGPMMIDQGHFELDPFEIIAVKFLTSVESIKTEEGKTEYMPAINLLALDNEKFKKDLRETVDVALLFSGGAGLLANGSKLARLFALLEVSYSAADLTINSFRSKIDDTEGGKDFLAIWDVASALIAIYGLARIITALPQLIKKLKDAYVKFRAKAPKNLSGDEIKKLDKETEPVFQGFKEANLERIKKQTKAERQKELEYDPKNKADKPYEGEIGVVTEQKYGYFERDPSGNGDFISLSGTYEGRVFDAIGIPEKAKIYHTDDLKDFIPALDHHFYKVKTKAVDYLILDTRAMNQNQIKNLTNYIDIKWSSLKGAVKYL